MQTKIIYVLLFILSFNIMHDSVINIMDSNVELPIAHYVDCSNEAQEYVDIHDIHAMFHFIALSTSHTPLEVLIKKVATFSHDIPRSLSPYLKRNNKPPIA